MGDSTTPKLPGSFDMRDLNRHVTVRYRHIPPNRGRVFIANASKSVDALVTDVSENGIGFILDAYLEPATPVRIEIGNGGSMPYLDLVAHVTRARQLEKGEWRCSCQWERLLTPEELLLSRYRTFHAPHKTR